MRLVQANRKASASRQAQGREAREVRTSLMNGSRASRRNAVRCTPGLRGCASGCIVDSPRR